MCFGALLELMVDRTRGDTRRGQWTQQEGSAHLTGCWIHCCDVREAYQRPGTLRFHKDQFEIGIRGLRKGSYLRDALSYQWEALEKERAAAAKASAKGSGKEKGDGDTFDI